MSDNSGNKEMESSKNNLPEVVKTNDAPSPVFYYIIGFDKLGWQ